MAAKTKAIGKLRVPAKVRPRPKPLSLEQQKTAYVRRLNDLYVATQASVEALSLRRAQIGKDKKKSAAYHFEVPSGGKNRTARIKRDPAQMREVLDHLITYGERSRALLMAVSLAEDYLLNVLKLLLRAYPARLLRGPKGGEQDIPIKLDEILAKSREEILEERVRMRLHNALYSSPQDYFGYLRQVLQIDLDQTIVDRFIEAKATRDIVIHASGIANDIYVKKAGDNKRGESGDPLPIDESYFDSCIAAMKSLIVNIHDGVKTKYNADENVQRCVPRFGI